LRNQFGIGAMNGGADFFAVGLSGKIIERITPQIVCLTVLMQNPDDFAWMGNQVGGELQGDQTIDWNAYGFAQVEQTAGEHVVENTLGGIPLEGHSDDFGLMASLYQRPAQSFGVELGTPVHEGNPDGSNQNS
jgi:hypothetical protein